MIAKIDALVAEHVMGWRLPQVGFFPSRDISTAWLVVETMRARGCFFYIKAQERQYYVCFRNENGLPRYGSATGETAALAICLAALRVVGALRFVDESGRETV